MAGASGLEGAARMGQRWHFALAVGIAVAGLIILLSWLAPRARADDVSGTYIATVYGPCCDGNVSRDGRTWYPFDWQQHVTVAHATIPRGTRIMVWLPPEGAFRGALVWAYEDGAPLTVTDACAIDWAVACPPNQVDLSYELIRRAGWCAPVENPWRCMARWGRRAVQVWAVAPAPVSPPPPHYDAPA